MLVKGMREGERRRRAGKEREEERWKRLEREEVADSHTHGTLGLLDGSIPLTFNETMLERSRGESVYRRA